MNKSFVILGTYSHLPYGADESQFEEAYQVAWRPFLSVLYRFPDIAATVAYSGTTLKWLESRHPEFLMLMEEMAIRKQIELLGGGFFAPLLPLVPGPDRLGQIELLTTYIRKAFGKRPRGCWMQDYAWEPTLASTLQASGFDFSFLPIRHFRLAGFENGAIADPVMTEDQGRSIVVFPVMDSFESFPSVLPPAEAVREARKGKGESPLCTIFYSQNSIRSLWSASKMESPDVMFEAAFAAIQKLAPEIETTTPSRYIKSLRRFGQAYFPGSASLALLTHDRKKGAYFHDAYGRDDSLCPESLRNLLLKHEESMALYAKMHYVRILVGQLRGDKSRKKTAQEELWRGQCGDAFWPGPSGGIAQLSIRAAAYGALIEAEKTTRLRSSFAPGVISADIDFDGLKEILYQGADLNAYVHLRGGNLTELDSLRSCWNYVNVMSSLAEGAARRPALIDRIMRKGSFGPDRGDFAESCYTLVENDRPANSATLSHEGWLDAGAQKSRLSIAKTFIFRKNSVSVEYELSNPSSTPLSFRFAVECNFSAGLAPAASELSVSKGRDASLLDTGAICEALACNSLRLTNLRSEEKIEIRSDQTFDLRHEPVVLPTVGGDTKVERYQGCRIYLGWDLDIQARSAQNLAITLELRA